MKQKSKEGDHKYFGDKFKGDLLNRGGGWGGGG